MIPSKERRIATAMTKETKKKRLARIRRHTSSLPKISSYDTTSNVEDGSKYGDYICKFIHVLSTLCYLCSLFVLMMEINNFPVPILGFGLLLFKILVLDLFLSIMGKSRYWPKTIDICAATVFGLSAVFNFIFPSTTIQFRSLFGVHILTFGSLTVYIAITWFLLFSLLFVVLILIRIYKKLLQNMTKRSTSQSYNYK